MVNFSKMNSLELYIKENQQISLSEYLNINDEIICEGLFGWLKKFWNWMFNDAKKNVKENGHYKISNDLLDYIQNEETGKCQYSFAQLDKENLTKFLNSAASTKKNTQFGAVIENYKKVKNPKVFSIKTKLNKTEETAGFILCTETDKKQLNIEHIIFANSIVSSAKDIKTNPFASETVKAFKQYVNKEIKGYTLVDKVDSNVVWSEFFEPDKEESKEEKSEDSENDNKDQKSEETKENTETEDSTKDNKDQKSEETTNNSAKNIIELVKKSLTNYRVDFERLLGDSVKDNFPINELTSKEIDYNNVKFEFKKSNKITGESGLKSIIDELKSQKPIIDWSDKINDAYKKVQEKTRYDQLLIETKFDNKLVGVVFLEIYNEGILNFRYFSWNKKFLKEYDNKIFNESFAACLLFHLNKYINDETQYELS